MIRGVLDQVLGKITDRKPVDYMTTSHNNSDNISLSDSAIRAIRDSLCAWFAVNRRELPWRQSYDPYQVWIAEIMGQQTQMERVVAYFIRWMELFPDVGAVAKAPEQKILKAWEGLGYYSRARNIQACAGILLDKYHGRIPDDPQQLLALPGIGPYTAAAIASIAYNRPCPLLDANVERLFSRLIDLDIPVKQAPAPGILRRLAQEMLPVDNARLFNQALMEFGALVCTAKKPGCATCPLAGICYAYQRGTVDLRPVAGKKRGRTDIVMACGVIRRDDMVYIQQRRANDLWGGLWEFPGGRLEEGDTPEQALRREILKETNFSVFRLRPLATVVHHYTRYRVTLHGFTCLPRKSSKIPVLHSAERYAWVPLSGLADFPFSAGQRKLLGALARKIS